MRIQKIELKNVKSFDGIVRVELDPATSMFAFSGMNGAGKSTFLKMAWLIQKAHFTRNSQKPEAILSLKAEIGRFLNNFDSYAELTISHNDEIVIIRLERQKGGDGYNLVYTNELFANAMWNFKSPSDIILYVDASKGFSEATLRFDEINIDDNERSALSLEAIFHPEQLFSGIYRQLVKDYVHGRLIPSKPDRLLYYHVASKIFTKLIPNVELKNFSGNYKPKEFVLLGKANADKYKPLYDVREFSSGEKALLSTLTFLCISKSVGTLIIDEPENHFHESLLLELMSVLHRLCDKGGLYSFISEADPEGKKINLEWVETEYRDHNLGQVIVSTHSKSLIYKFFSIGKNFVVNKGISEILYDNAEAQLRKIGLSTTFNKVILVEGDGDNEALENLVKGRNIKIKSLNGSAAVVETFRRIAEIRKFVQDSKFVFLVDSDNKPDNFFTDLRAVDPGFYDGCFVKLNAHEFENLYLEADIFKTVLDGYAAVSGVEQKMTEQDIEDALTVHAKSSLPQVFKKELSLALQYGISTYFSEKFWGNKGFDWQNAEKVGEQISDALNENNQKHLELMLMDASKAMFANYENLDGQSLIQRCDGKQVLGKACGAFGKIAGVDGKKFKEAIFHTAANKAESKIAKLADDLIKRLDKTH